MRTSTIGRAVTFAGAARCYWLEIFPFARRELREWRRRAEAIPEPGLRRDALLALQAKGGNAEGLAAFAVLAPAARAPGSGPSRGRLPDGSRLPRQRHRANQLTRAPSS